MKCREAEGAIAAFLAEELAKEPRRRLKIHLRGCKACQGKLNRLKKEAPPPAVAHETGDRQPEAVLSPDDPVSPASDVLPAPEPKTFSSFPYMSAIGMVTILFILGGMAYFLSQGSTEPKPVSPAEATAPAPAPSSSPEAGPARPPDALTGAAASPPASTPVPQEAPVIKKAGNGKPHDLLPKKTGNGKPHDLSKGSRAKPISKGPAVKLLLISRDLKEAVREIQSRAAESEGKILQKREGELTARFTLLLPAGRYESFFESLQQLGLAKEVSKKGPPAEGPVKLELTIE